VFITDPALQASGLILEPSRRQRIDSSTPFDINGILFTPFAVPHDASDPVAFTIERSGIKAAIVVDLGCLTNLVTERLRECDCIVLESNHDLRMLQVGPYPWALKQRVMSRLGHLSNDSVARYLADDFDGRARHVILAHLSKKNNLPELALGSARRALEGRSMLRTNQTRLELARPDEVSRTYSY
jgi:phosphoribosyl 1,2-cyclic phosphodiesterase